jgi:hypothetical protein
MNQRETQGTTSKRDERKLFSNSGWGLVACLWIGGIDLTVSHERIDKCFGGR